MRITLLSLIIGTIMIIGCSSGNPVTAKQDCNSQSLINSDSYIIGAYNFTINIDSISAELNEIRMPSIGESWTLSGKSFFDIFPCRDCFRICGLGYEDGKIIAHFSIRHPFQKGNPMLPPTGKNRLDLDLFDPALIVVPKPLSQQYYPRMNVNLQYGAVGNPDGFTRELSYLTGVDIALPFVLIVDDSKNEPPSSTYNKFEMGESKEFEVKFPVNTGETLVFDLYLTFGYGSSATFEQRLNPTYYNPEFNKKAAWRVEVIPPNGENPPTQGNTWDDFDSSTEYNVTVNVCDWQIGADVDPNLTNPAAIYSASDVDYVCVEIPGMTNSLKQVDGDSYIPGGTGMPGSPLVYQVPIANENHLVAGEYIGLVGVYDERIPKGFSNGRDYLIHSPDGVILNQYPIASYITYQTFVATVIAGSMCTGNLIWAKSAGGSDLDEGNGITSLSDNSVVVSGSFGNSATFGKGEPNQTILTSAGSSDVFVARYNPDGALAWAKSAGGLYYDECPGITSLTDNSTVVTGYFYSPTITFGKGEPNQTILTNTSGELDIFIAKYNPDGTLAWAKRAGGNADDSAYAITSLSDDSTILTGFFYESATFGKGEPNQTVLNSPDGWIDIFIARYNPNGTLAWAKSAGGTGDDEGYAVAALSDNSSVATGFFGDITGGPATFGKGEANETVLTPSGEADIFIARYNPNGTLAWAKSAGGSSYIWSQGIASLTDNTTILTGYFTDSTTFGKGEPNQIILNSSGAQDIFIARYNQNGTLAWAKAAGGVSGDDIGYGITALSDNSTVVSGFFSDSAIFAPGESNETTLTSISEVDIFIARYNPEGSLMWVKNAGGSSWDKGYGITSLSDNSTIATGWFTQSATFGSGEPNQTILTAVFYSDIFIARFEP